MLENLGALTAVRGRQLIIRERDVIDHLDAAVAAGVRVTPALVLHGRLVASGSVTPKALSKILQNAMTGDSKDGTHDR
jgi:predicted DsbA family dithiol-disulfide isomerase